MSCLPQKGSHALLFTAERRSCSCSLLQKGELALFSSVKPPNLHLVILNLYLVILNLCLVIPNLRLTVLNLRLAILDLGLTILNLRLAILNLRLTIWNLLLAILNLRLVILNLHLTSPSSHSSILSPHMPVPIAILPLWVIALLVASIVHSFWTFIHPFRESFSSPGLKTKKIHEFSHKGANFPSSLLQWGKPTPKQDPKTGVFSCCFSCFVNRSPSFLVILIRFRLLPPFLVSPP